MGDPRAQWQDDDRIEFPSLSDRNWEPGERPPAQYQNEWQYEVFQDLADIAAGIFLNESGDQNGRLKTPVELGGGAIGNIYVESQTDVGEFAVAQNAKWDSANSQWVRQDNTLADPVMLVYGPNVSNISGITSTDVDLSSFVLLETDSISNDVVTWTKSQLSVATSSEPQHPIIRSEADTGDTAGSIAERDDRGSLSTSLFDFRGYLEPGGLVIANNGTNPNTQIDVDVPGYVYVENPSDPSVYSIVEVPSRSPAFDISTTGVNSNVGGRINTSSLNNNDWYRLAVIASATDDTLDPVVVGYTVGSADNTPQSEADLPGNYDLFRAMGPQARNWHVKTDGSGNILGFQHFSTGDYVWDVQVVQDTFSNLEQVDPTNNRNTVDASEQIPPGEYTVSINGVEVNANSNGVSLLTVNGEQLPSDTDGVEGQVITRANVNSIDTSSGIVNNITNQEILRAVSSVTNTDNVLIRKITSFRGD